MIINSTYLANWQHVTNLCNKNTLYNNLQENKKRIDYDYKVGGYIYIIMDSAITCKLDPLVGPLKIIQVHINGNVTG